jgi:hypothetical protein
MSTHAFKIIKDFSNFEGGNEQLRQLTGVAGHQLIMSDASATELEIEKLINAGYLMRLTDEQALREYKGE